MGGWKEVVVVVLVLVAVVVVHNSSSKFIDSATAPELEGGGTGESRVPELGSELECGFPGLGGVSKRSTSAGGETRDADDAKARPGQRRGVMWDQMSGCHLEPHPMLRVEALERIESLKEWTLLLKRSTWR